MDLRLWLFLLGFSAASSAAATNYYVASGTNAPVTGVNTTANGQGLSPTKPFATIQYAADRTLPGDTVFVRAGTYTNPNPSGAVARLTRSGQASAWIVYRNYPGERPLLQANGWQGFVLADGAAYVEINGFRIQGDTRNQTLAQAQQQNRSCRDDGTIRPGEYEPKYNTNGISADGRSSQSTGHPHHLRFRNNEIFECGGAGISAIQCDYVTIENNLIYNNSWHTLFGTSGISLYQNWNYDTAPGYHMIVRNNRCFGNRLYVKWAAVCDITDGNGIIIDDSKNTQNGSTLGAYTGRTLVANNLVVGNGGSGIHSFLSEHVDIINNTAYRNGQSPEINNGEIYANRSNDVLFQNNILVATSGERVNTNYGNTASTHAHNLYFGGTTPAVLGSNPVQADPQFVNPTTDWRTADFRLRAGSPAIDRGLNNRLPATDLAGNPRVAGAQPDLGAYEFGSTVTTNRAPDRQAAFQLYPNPAHHQVRLVYQTAQPQPATVAVHDALGRPVYQQHTTLRAGDNTVLVPTAELAAGWYHVRLTTRSETVEQALQVLP